MMRRWLVVTLYGCLACALAGFGNVGRGKEDGETLTYEVVRVKIPGEDITQFGLLFRSPGTEAPAPGIIVLHGWATPGTVGAALVAYMAFEFQQAGYIAMALSLRGWPETGGRDDCGERQAHDVATAVRWFARQPGVLPEHMALVGHSQGGQIALLAGSLELPLRAIVAYAPATDLERWEQRTELQGIKRYLRNVCSQGAGLAVRSPISVAGRIRPPVLLIHGTGDERVPIEQSQRLLQAMGRAGRRDAILRIVPDAGHHWAELQGTRFALDFLNAIFAATDAKPVPVLTSLVTPRFVESKPQQSEPVTD